MVKEKCKSGKGECSLGNTWQECHLFHCFYGCSSFRGEADSCEHPCVICETPLKYNFSVTRNVWREFLKIDREASMAHSECWEAVSKAYDKHMAEIKAKQRLDYYF